MDSPTGMCRPCLPRTIHACRIGLAVLLALLFTACDATPPAAATAAGASPAQTASAAPACPATEIGDFVAAFAEDPALQKAFTADTVETAFTDWNAQPEPAERVETRARDALTFPVMPNRARQQADGLQYREIGSDRDRTTIVLEVPDTDAQLRYTFRRSGCWTLVKIVDPAFGKSFASPPPATEAPRTAAAVAAGHSPSASHELSTAFTDCMANAGSRTLQRADCLTAERDRQDARLNQAYKALISSLQGDSRERMVEAQRQWVELQQKDGAFETAILDDLGPMGNLQSVENEARAIGQRADQLERYLELGRL